MKPVAYASPSYRKYFDGSPVSAVPLGIDVSLVNLNWKDQIELYTADQLRQAKVEVLREAVEGHTNDDPLVARIRRMADELKAGK